MLCHLVCSAPWSALPLGVLSPLVLSASWCALPLGALCPLARSAPSSVVAGLMYYLFDLSARHIGFFGLSLLIIPAAKSRFTSAAVAVYLTQCSFL